MLLSPMKIPNKCKFYDKGYCKHKWQCKYLHPSNDCSKDCQDKTLCPNRHRKSCKYGIQCYHNQTNEGEYLYKHNDDTHKIILATPNVIEDELRKEIETLKSKIKMSI